MRFRKGNGVADAQLSLPLAWLSEEALLAALRTRGAGSLERVRFRPNRTRLVSLSADGRSLNVQTAFREAPSEVLDAIAVFASSRRADARYREAIRRLRAWWDLRAVDDETVRGAGGPRAACCGTAEQQAFLRSAYERLNRHCFGGGLPDDVPLRLSARMSRRFGHVYYGRAGDGTRRVEEIALNVDLMISGNEAHFLDTLLHEMAHAEAWLLHGHRDHGRIWRRIASRVGCQPRACSAVRIRRRRRRTPAVTTVPTLRLPA
jgi:hypothetical protein